MAHRPDSHTFSRAARLVERRDKLDKLIQAGRLTEDDAERLTAAAKSGELNDAAREMQLKHARARVNAAVEDGRLTQEDAQAIFDRLENGEDPRFLRGLRRGIPADR